MYGGAQRQPLGFDEFQVGDSAVLFLMQKLNLNDVLYVAQIA